MCPKIEKETVNYEKIESQALEYIRSKRYICFSDFEIQKIVGSGLTSVVKLATLKSFPSQSFFALKLISKSVILLKKQSGQLIHEKQVLEKIKHPFLVNYLRCFQDERTICFVFEFIDGCELFSLISRKTRLCDSWTQFYSAEILIVLKYLHQNKIIYRDLKPENVLIGRNGHVKLVDFGFSKVLDESRARTVCGTPEYLAPEILLRHKNGYDCAVDFWALGVLMFEMTHGLIN